MFQAVWAPFHSFIPDSIATSGYAKLKGYQRVGVRWLLALARLGHGSLPGAHGVCVERCESPVAIVARYGIVWAWVNMHIDPPSCAL